MPRAPSATRDATLRERLIMTAEKLYAAHGFAAVSLRQICAAAGARNHFAVQYHFRDLEGLALAIVDRRSADLEIRRGELLARAAAAGPLTPRIICEILNRPIVEQVNGTGDRIGARFMVALQNTDWGWRPLSEHLDQTPVTQQLIKSLEGLLPHLPPPVVWQRLYLVSLMVMNCAAQLPKQASEGFCRAVIANAFAMAAAALEIDIDPDTAAAMTEFHPSHRPMRDEP